MMDVRAVVTWPTGKFILVRDTCTPGWHLAAGGVDRCETAEDALVNDLRRGTGLILTSRPIRPGVFH